MRIGIDSGGTFTDFVVLRDDGRLELFKLRSNPTSPAEVILEGIARASSGGKVEVVHGSTVATNALLERKGAKTAFVTTAGFEDLAHIGRQNRPELYNLTPRIKPHLISSSLCFGIAERTYFDGTVSRKPTPADLKALAAKVRRSGAESIAICLLHSYENDSNERAVMEALSGLGCGLGRGLRYVCRSSRISPEFREYERASTTLINAYVGPLMDAYLGELQRGCPHPVAVMQSNGGFLTMAEARQHAVRTILSGPAGGIVGASAMARLSGFPRSLTFDMGGTSTDVSLAEERPRLTTESVVDGMPVRVPMLDIHTAGAGGGSLARVDEGGRLRVGPESAGANPGPACYGTGDEPTVTDAHVVLGRIAPEQFLGGSMRIDPARAATAVATVARQLGISLVDAAAGIVRIANSNMERAIRVVSVERGQDPRQFPLVAFGGCGGLHACEIADELGISTVVVPRFAEALSALGMLLADRARDYSMGALKAGDIARRFQKLETRARKEVRGARIERFADLRYAGQSYELTVPWTASDQAEPFHREHERIYGYCDRTRATEIVTVRVRAVLARAKPSLGRSASARSAKPVKRRVHVGGKWRAIPVWKRDNLSGNALPGPALILDYGSTTLVAPGWFYHIDRSGNLLASNR
ncbi:MAG: hydantoinase/oxoprolinase family protein [Bryobacteraceae bacterium]